MTDHARAIPDRGKEPTLLDPQQILLRMPPDVVRILDGEMEPCATCRAPASLDAQDFENMARTIRHRLAVASEPLIPATMYRVTIRCRNGHERIWRVEEPEPLPVTTPDTRLLELITRSCTACTREFVARTLICPDCLARRRGRQAARVTPPEQRARLKGRLLTPFKQSEPDVFLRKKSVPAET